MASALWFDTQNPPFNDVRVRRAVALSINRHEWDAVVQQGRGRVEFPVPSRFFPEWTQPESVVEDVLAFDLERAKRLLAEAGYPDGLRTVLFARGDRDSLGADVISDMLARVGIQAEIRLVEAAPLRERLLN